MRRMAGRTKSSKVTIAETGLPGSAKAARAPLPSCGMVENAIGLPGRMSTSQRCCSAPRRASASLTKSCSPTETPAEEIRMSQPSPQRKRPSISSRRSPAMPRLTGTAPASVTCAISE